MITPDNITAHEFIKFSIENKDVIVNGSRISKRPFDRIGAKL